MNSLAETPLQDTHNQKKNAKAKLYTTKRALHISDTPAIEALARISSAVERSKRAMHPEKEPIPQEKRASLDKQFKSDILKPRMKYFEVPGLLDGFRMLNRAPAEDPDDVHALDITGQNLRFVLEDDLSMFTKLQILKAGENELSFPRIGVLPSLRKLYLPCNDISSLDLDSEGRFTKLEHLDLSYNNVDHSAILVLATLPNLHYLDLTSNNISSFPRGLRDMKNWRDQVIEMLLPAQVAALDASIQPNESSRGYTPFTAMSNSIGVNATEFHQRHTISAKSKNSRMDSPRKTESLRESLASATFKRPISEELRNSAKEREGAFRQMISSSQSDRKSIAKESIVSSNVTKPTEHRSQASKSAQVTKKKIGNQEFAMDMIGSAHFLISESAGSKRTRSTSAPTVIENKNVFLDFAYPNLHTLILERNKIISPEIFDVLAVLPNLTVLNINHNYISTLSMLIPIQMRGAADVLTREPNTIIKYDGFKKLQELSIQHNKLHQIPEIVGLVCLPVLKRVFIAGNPVVQKYALKVGSYDKKKDPFDIFPSIYKIKIMDLPTVAHTNLGPEDLYYSIQKTEYGPAVVRLKKKKEISHFVGHILRKNAPAAVHGSRLRAPHTITDFEEPSRSLRRAQSFTEEDMEDIIRTGQIPRLSELMYFKAKLNLWRGSELAEQENPPENATQGEKNSPEYDPERKDSTFITGVHILEERNQTAVTQDSIKLVDFDIDEKSDDEDFRQHYPLPMSVQDAVKSLRHALLNPTSYWRVLEESYVRPTVASTNRKVIYAQKPRNGPLDGNYIDANSVNPSMPMTPSTPFMGNVRASQYQTPDNWQTPANSYQTPYAKKEDYPTQNVQYKIKKGKQVETQKDPDSFNRAVFTKLMGEDTEDMAGTLAYKKTAKKLPKIKKRGQEAGHWKPKDDFEEMTHAIAEVDRKLLLIETDLAAVLASSHMRSRIPQSKKLLEEIQQEYARIEQMYMLDAEYTIQGHHNVLSETSMEEESETYKSSYY